MSPAEASGGLQPLLSTLEQQVRKNQPPSHYLARGILVELGRVLREEGPRGPEALERVRETSRGAGPRWDEAVRAELAMACAEFVQSMDPRYLHLPNYDVDYTVSARIRLEDRLRAARGLGFGLPPRELELLELADRVLSEFLSGSPEAPGKPPGAPSG